MTRLLDKLYLYGLCYPIWTFLTTVGWWNPAMKWAYKIDDLESKLRVKR